MAGEPLKSLIPGPCGAGSESGSSAIAEIKYGKTDGPARLLWRSFLDMASLPLSTSHSGGEEWRDLDVAPEFYNAGRSADTITAARKQIREIRMRDVELRIVDRRGHAVAGTAVEIEQIRNAFPFGEQLWPLDAMVRDGEGEGERARAWKRRFAEIFNSATSLCYWTERDRHDASKTEDCQGDWRLDNFAATVDWTISQGLTAKGHPLFWPIPKAVPKWVQRYDYATQMKFAEVRVRNIVARFKGRIRIWDAVNEPMWEPAFKNLSRRDWPHIEQIGEIADYIEPVLRWCREEDPDARYLINDYGMEADMASGSLRGNDGSIVTAPSQRQRFLALLRELQDRGTPPDAIGLQNHTGWPQHEEQWAVYDEFATSGLPVHITEFWASTHELEQSGKYSSKEIDEIQAEYVANFLTCAYGHPAVEGFFFWGFMNSAITWGERSGHDVKPVFERVRKLLRDEWMTRQTLITDPEGIVRFRGFFGDYSLRVPIINGVRSGLCFQVDPSATMPLLLRTPLNANAP